MSAPPEPRPTSTSTTRVDELFGEGGATPRARFGLIVALLLSGLVATILGLACSTVPGGLLLLAAWVVVEKDLMRVEAGFLPVRQASTLQLLRGLTMVLVVLATISFVVQTWLMQAGFYTELWGGLLELWFGPA